MLNKLFLFRSLYSEFCMFYFQFHLCFSFFFPCIKTGNQSVKFHGNKHINNKYKI